MTFAGTLEPASAAQELRKGGCGFTVLRNRCEENEYRLALSYADVLRLIDEANVPADGSTLVLVLVAVSEKKRQLESFGETDEPELRGGRERLRDVAAIESSAEAHIGRTLRGHEQMFVHTDPVLDASSGRAMA